MSKSNTQKSSKNFHFMFPIVLTIINVVVLAFVAFIFFASSIPFYGFITVFLAVTNGICSVLCVIERKKRKEEDRAEKEKTEKMKERAADFAISTFNVLMQTLEEKDSYTSGHSSRVAKYALMIADVLKLNERDKLLLRLSGWVHDIGKVGIPDHILNKTDKLEPEEMEKIRLHTEKGYKILEHIPMFEVKNIAKYHHENFDGSGYPEGLKKDRIPRLARIIRVADSYDAITSKRCYKYPDEEISQEKIIKDFEEKKGTWYDPEVADAMIMIIKNDKKFKLRVV